MINRHMPKRILVLGAGPEAQALVQRLAMLPGVASVRQQSSYMPGTALPEAHLCVEMLAGLSMAYEAAMQALAQGMGLVVGSPLLAATHGPLLQRAAQGQGAFYAVAAHGLGNVPALLSAMQASQLVWLPAGAAQQVVARVVARRENTETATRQLQLRGVEMADLNGKTTHLCAHALLGAWQAVWPEVSRQPRLGVDQLNPAMLPTLNALGLRLAYGAVVTATGVRTGPLALPTSVTIPEPGDQVLLATTPQGAMQLNLPAEGAREAALVDAVQAYTRGQRQTALAAEPYITGAIKLPYQVVLSTQPVVGVVAVASHSAGGWWGGVVAASGPQDWPRESLVLPIPVAYSPPAAPALRLVG